MHAVELQFDTKWTEILVCEVCECVKACLFVLSGTESIEKSAVHNYFRTSFEGKVVHTNFIVEWEAF